MAEHNSSLIVYIDGVTLIAMLLKGAASAQFSSSSGCIEGELMVLSASLSSTTVENRVATVFGTGDMLSHRN